MSLTIMPEKKVVSYCAIPEKLTKGHWISEFTNGCFVEVHIPDDEADDALTAWLRKTYPELVPESFFIEIDY